MLIGLVAKKQAGKGLFAQAFAKAAAERNETTEIIKFATPLKEMIQRLMDIVGIDRDRQLRYIEGDLKEAPIKEFNGITCRHMMQTLGTEWARKQLDIDFWLNIWIERVKTCKATHVIVDDVRYENEAALVRYNKGRLIYINRPGLANGDGHTSETELAGIECFVTFTNEGTIEESAARALEFSRSLLTL